MPDARRYDWDYLVVMSGDEGRAWISEYSRPEYAEIAQDTARALGLARTRQVERGLAVIKAAGARLAALRGARPSVVHVLERFYYGVSAYCLYCLDDLDAAERDMFAADRAVRAAVEHDRVLLPLAHHCHEFHLHHARIARNRRCFQEMRREIDIVRAMVENRLPLCDLNDGTRVDYTTLARYCAALPPLDDAAREVVRPFTDEALRRALLERFVLELYLLPGFVIPGA
jgi:hypothetical protein